MLLHIFYGRLTRLGVFGHRYSAYGLVTPGVGSTARREARLSYTFRIYKQHSFALRFVLLQSSGREGGFGTATRILRISFPEHLSYRNMQAEGCCRREGDGGGGCRIFYDSPYSAGWSSLSCSVSYTQGCSLALQLIGYVLGILPRGWPVESELEPQRRDTASHRGWKAAG